MHYITVFDVARDGFTAWWFPAAGLIFVAISGAVFLYRRRHPDPRGGFWRRASPGLGLGFAVFWTLGAFGLTYADYVQLREALRTRHYEVVEGVVTDFKPQPPEGHADEEFDVGGRHYAFSDYVVTAGYHRSRSHGGVFRDGLRVRIADVGGQIARIEVAAGEQGDSTPR